MEKLAFDPLRTPEVARFETPITNDDRELLTSLGIIWPEEPAEESWLTSFNELVDLGSLPKEDSAMADEARRARTTVAKSLTGISEKERRALVQDMQDDSRSLRRTFATARILHYEDVNVATAAGYNSQILSVHPAIALTRIANLKALGFKVDDALIKAPQLLCSLPKTVRDCFEYLESQGIDVASIATRVPGVFAFSQKLIAKKLATLRAQGFDIVSFVNAEPEILRCDLSKADTRLTNLRSLGLNIKKVAPKALGRSSEVIIERLNHLSKGGFNAIKVMNDCPSIVSLALPQIEAKIQNIASLGLNTKSVINGSPEVLKYAIPSLKTKFMLIQSACRAWGFGDGRAKACELVNHYPKLFTSSPHKIRTLIRVASTIMPSETRQELTGINAYQMTVHNIEAVVAGALEYQAGKHEQFGRSGSYRHEIETVNDWRSLSKQYKKLGKPALAEIIALHPDDQVVKMYRKGLRKAA